MEIQDGSATFEVRSIPDIYKEIKSLKQFPNGNYCKPVK